MEITTLTIESDSEVSLMIYYQKSIFNIFEVSSFDFRYIWYSVYMRDCTPIKNQMIDQQNDDVSWIEVSSDSRYVSMIYVNFLVNWKKYYTRDVSIWYERRALHAYDLNERKHIKNEWSFRTHIIIFFFRGNDQWYLTRISNFYIREKWCIL